MTVGSGLGDGVIGSNEGAGDGSGVITVGSGLGDGVIGSPVGSAVSINDGSGVITGVGDGVIGSYVVLSFQGMMALELQGLELVCGWGLELI